MKFKTSILVVEPSDIIVEGLRQILNESGQFNMLASLHDAVGLTERLTVQQPDILLINPTLLASPTRQQFNQLQLLRPSMPIVGLVYQYVGPELLQAFRWLLDIRDNRSAIIALLLECGKTASEEPDTSDNYELSERETDVLVLVAKGCSSKEIANRLHISIHTVNSHRKNITHKTGIKSVAGLAVYAMLHNLT